MARPLIVWFRLDLRCEDNPALTAAIEAGGPILPVFIWSPEEEAPWSPGGATRWWLHQSLQVLEAELAKRGAPLVVLRGPTQETLHQLARETNARGVYWNRRYEPVLIARDTAVKKSLLALELEVKSFNGSLLHEPWEIVTGGGTPYKVYTPFSKTCLKRPLRKLLPAPKSIASLPSPPAGCGIDALKLKPTIPWDVGMAKEWTPGTEGGKRELRRFLSDALSDYHDTRNIPSVVGTSRLSPYLHFGELSPQQVWHAVEDALEKTPGASAGAEVYCRELLWREFAYHLLFHFPHTPEQPLREEFLEFPWRKDDLALKAWQRGNTGYPIVDAGMRELWTTGWMHNRVRMIVASFLVKDLFQPWQAGAKWFWDTLVDADLASNTLGWQWTAGCGADAAPFFRVFNPSGQGERFDARGGYIKKWCPELRELPDKWIHRPWEAPKEVLERAGVRLGENYPRPIVDHQEMRAEALEAYEALPKGAKRSEERDGVEETVRALGG